MMLQMKLRTEISQESLSTKTDGAFMANGTTTGEPTEPRQSFFQLSPDDATKSLNTSAKAGLSENEAELRLSIYGTNEIDEQQRRTWPGIFLAQLQSSLVVLLIFAALISLVLGEATDAIAVLAIIVLNTALGFWQDFSAEKSLAELKKLSVPDVTVTRDGETKTVAAAQVVPGDVVSLKAGYFVPADCRLLEQSNLLTDESALTGESLPIEKTIAAIEAAHLPLGDQTNMARSGTMVVRGHGIGVVTTTGMSTELGKVASSLKTVAPEPTPLQTKLAQLSRSLALLAILIVVLVFAAGMISGQPVKLMLMTALSMAVAIVPEGLPAVATVALAVGARKMFIRNALIRQLPAVETLGSVSVICSDKTGTLTQNRMTVTKLDVANYLFEVNQHRQLNKDLRTLLLAATLCNDAELKDVEPQPNAVGEPTESALVEVAAKLGVNQKVAAEEMPRVAEVPFSSDRKRMTTIHNVEGLPFPIFEKDARHVAFCKGAVDRLLEVSDRVHIEGSPVQLTEAHVARIKRSRDSLASQGNRVLAVAIRPIQDFPLQDSKCNLQKDEVTNLECFEHNMIFVGLIAMTDPPRPEARSAVAQCKAAGIRPIMITGDHPLTALSIANQIGIDAGDKVITGTELSQMSAGQLSGKVKEVSVFARVAPADKLNIVEALQRHNEVVAMTGDGVNDAPALKQANIGVAMGITGTDVSKQAANMVLLDDNFSTIVEAVELGRTVYDNIRKFVKYTMSSNIGEVMVMTIGVLLGWPLPLLPLQILWVNLVTDGLPGLALAVEPTEANAMKRPPLPLNEPIFNRKMLFDLLWIGSLICIASLGTAAIFWNEAKGVDHWRTIIFTALTMSQMANVFACRSESSFLFSGRLFQNRWIWLAVASTFLLQIAVIYWPPMQQVFHTTSLSVVEIASCLVASLLVLLAIEGFKHRVW